MKLDLLDLWPLFAVGLAVFLALLVPDRDGSFLPYMLISFPIVGLLVADAIRKKGQRRLLRLVTVIIYCAIFAVILSHFSSVHTAARWLVWSHDYKAKVLAQRPAAGGELRHAEWDDWGFAGAGNTTVYLVFDPTDSLSLAAKSHRPGNFSGIPCKVQFVDRIEEQWYTVRFYTDENWGQRNRLNCSTKN